MIIFIEFFSNALSTHCEIWEIKKEDKTIARSKVIFSTFITLFFALILPIFWILNAAGLFTPPHKTAHQVQAQNVRDIKNWPPVLGQKYPDLALYDQDGKVFKLSQFKGKVIILEPVGMNCPACQAFSGAKKYGPFKNNPVQKGVSSFHDIFRHYTPQTKNTHSEIIFVQILLYDMKLEAPDKEDARAWAEHFHLSKANNHYVSVSPYDLRNHHSFKMIPGFQLIDKDFILRIDSTGHRPKHSLYYDLLPALKNLTQSR